MTNDDTESEPDRPIKLHANGDAGAIAFVSEDELERLEDGEPFWKVVEEVPEFTPGSNWDWTVASQPDEHSSSPTVQESDNSKGGAE